LILVYATLPGCLPYYYAPNSHNIPMFRQKGEVRIEAATGMGSLTSGAEFKGAYAAGNHTGLIFNTFFNNGEGFLARTFEVSNDKARGNLVEGGMGYFTNFGNEKFIFETYGGIGGGKIKNYYRDFQTLNNTEGSSLINYSRYFIQPSLGLVTNYIDFIISARFAGLSLNTIRTDGGVTRDLEELNRNKSMFLVEPAVTLRFGWKPVKFQLQLVLSDDLNDFPLAKEFRYLNLGVIFTIPTRN